MTESNEGMVIIVAKWIGVHDTVDGPKLRRLCKQLNCPKAEALGILCYLWMWGQENATKYGEILDADKEEIASHLAYMDKGSTLNFEQVVDALIDCKWLDELDGELYIHDWDTWQGVWYKAMERRERDIERKRKAKAAQMQTMLPEGTGDFEGEYLDEENAAGDADAPLEEIGGEGEGVPPAPPPPEPKRTRKDYSKPFEEFWKAYPRPIDKGNAYLKYQARRKDGYSDDELLIAAKNYAAECRRKGTEKEFIKHPKTFLSDTLPFTDYLPKEQPAFTTEPQSGNPFQKYGGKK